MRNLISSYSCEPFRPKRTWPDGTDGVSEATSNLSSLKLPACNWHHKCCRKPVQVLGILVLAGVAAHAAPVDVPAIIQHSVAVNEMNWKAAPNYSFVERDVEVKG